MKYFALLPVFLAACASPSLQGFGPTPTPAADPAAAIQDAPVETLDPTPPPKPPARATTAAQFDTASAEDKAEALAVEPEPAKERELGRVVVSLGAPTDPGIWVKTPLVKVLTPGRVEVLGTGKTANIELRPGDGSTQMSLSAMRLLEIPLTDLPEVILYAK